MATCARCGAELATSWKYCIHCGIGVAAFEIPAFEIPAAIRPETQPPTTSGRARRRNAVYLSAGILSLMIGLCLLGYSIAYLVGMFR